MGRGRQPKRSRPGGRNFSNKRQRLGANIDKKQKTHLKQFGEAHPVDDSDNLTSHKYKVIKDDGLERSRYSNSQRPPVTAAVATESSDDEPEENTYMDLLSTLGVEQEDADSSSEVSEDEIDGESDHSGSDEEIADYDDDEEADDNDEDADNTADSVRKNGNSVDGEETSSDTDERSNIDVAENGNEMLDAVEELDDEEECLEADENGDVKNDEAEELVLLESDPFRQHVDNILAEGLARSIFEKKYARSQETLNVPHLNKIDSSWPSEVIKRDFTFTEHDVRQYHVKQSLCNQLALANLKCAHVDLTGNDSWTPLQQSVFACINSYRDFYFPERSYKRGEELRLVYCLHALNHMLKTRGRIMVHNSKIRSRNDDIPDDFRDKGFTRPKVLILVPFRDSALRIVNIMSELLADKQNFVSTRSRFVSEYSSRENEPETKSEFEDLETIFTGNTNECFSIGIGIAKKTLKLYTKFSDSDIILASPLGLWGVTEAKNEGEAAGSESDFLSSIEVMIIDQADVLMMQNWDHVLSLLERVNRQPVSPTGIDFSRVRMWTLNGWSKLYRQTIMLSEFDILQLQSTFRSLCCNYAGRLIVHPKPTGVWFRVFVRMRHEFCRFSADDAKSVDERRFKFFTSSLLSTYADGAMAKTLVFLSSSFDFIRLRNHLMRRRIEFVTLTEYDDSDTMKRARSDFVNGDRVQLMLVTERFLFYRRRELQKITGVRHVLFYDLPTRPLFYADVCNWVRDHRPRHRHNEDSATVRVLYCKYDIQRLRGVLGVERADLVQVALKDKTKYMLDPPMLEN